ncbi:MAG: flagellar basal body rod protein FlgB [Candidatus Nitrospinota bacterium M3_3B_026]
MGDIYKIRHIGYLQKALDMTVARQNAVAANIANASTPGYKALRVKFEDKLKAAIGDGAPMAETNPKHLPNGMAGVYGVEPSVAKKLGGARLDGATVNLEEEFSKSTVNGMEYQLYIAALEKHMKNLLSSFEDSVGGR